MNFVSKTMNILCFGDSNTWGQVPFEPIRYELNQRWTGLLQTKLHSVENDNLNYKVIEQGLSARTAGNIDVDKPERNGLEYFQSKILGKVAFDIAIIALGTNDFKTKYNLSPQQVYADLISYQALLKSDLSPEPKIIYLLPPNISNSVEGFENYHQKLQKLVDLFKKQDELDFLDLSDFNL